MKERPRLLDAPGNARARALLRAGLADGPSQGATARAVAALGLGAATAAVAGMSAAGTSKASVGGALTVLAKAGGGGIVVGAVVLVASSSPPLAPAAVEVALPAPSAQLAPRAVVTPSSAAPSEPAAPIARAAPSEATARTTAKVAAPRPTSSSQPVGNDELDAEVALVDSARRALLRGAPGEALGLLNRHRREHPNGVMQPEVFLLRLEAMVRAGRGAAAQALAREYLEQHPSGSHAERVRKIAGE